MKVTTVAINLAKSLFQIRVEDERRKSAVTKQLKSNQVILSMFESQVYF